MTPQSDGLAAAIDIGSNSIKMTIGRPASDGGVEQVDWASEVVRLGHDLDRTGRLDDERIEAALDTLRRFSERARELGADRVVGVATEATRAAENGAAFLGRVRDETGIDVRVVDGDEEAALTFRGLLATTDMSGPVVIADIGGGSTELIFARDGAMHASRSLALGSGRLTDRLVKSDPPLPAELVASEVEASTTIAADDALPPPDGPGTRLIVVGGTGEFMARLVPDESNISLAVVRQVLSRLESLPAAELATKIDIPEARARVLPAGVSIVAAIAERIQPNRIEVSRSGVRAGLLLEAFAADVTSTIAPKRSPAEEPRRTTGAKGREKRAFPCQPPPQPEPGFRDTMKALIAERWATVWQAIPVALEGSDIEGVHDVRVASRRLRAAMDIAAPVFPQGWYKALHRTAKAITGALGEVRDRDVLLEALAADRAAAPLTERPGIDRLIARVERERAAARVEMEQFLNDLLSGPIPDEVERRFGPKAKGDDSLDGAEESQT